MYVCRYTYIHVYIYLYIYAYKYISDIYILPIHTYTYYLTPGVGPSPKSDRLQGSVGALFVQLGVCARRQATADDNAGQCLDHVRHLRISGWMLFVGVKTGRVDSFWTQDVDGCSLRM